MTTFRFRASVAAPTAPPRIDRDAGVIRGVAVMQAVEEASGHRVAIDTKALQAVVALGNAAPNGIKVRFTHPGMCDDGMGKMLGRVRNFRMTSDNEVAADLHLNESSAKSPDGDLRAYVLGLAEEDPESFGLSAVVMSDHVWKMADGSESPASKQIDEDTHEMVPRPDGALGKFPVLRPLKLSAVDVVDEPAATRGGLLAAFSANGVLAAESFAAIDRLREASGLDASGCFGFVARYFRERGLGSLSLTTTNAAPGAVSIDLQTGRVTSPPITTAGPNPANPKKGNDMDKEALKAFKAKHPDHAGLIVDMFADGKSEAEMLAAIKDAEIDLLTQRNVALTESDKASKAALAAKDQEIADLRKKVAFGANSAEDPGAEAPAAGTDADQAIKESWAKLSADAKKGFVDYDCYRLLALNGDLKKGI